MGYFNFRINQFRKQFYSVYEKNEFPQMIQIKNAKCNIETLPYFLELFIQVAEHLLTEIKEMSSVSKHLYLPLENPNQSSNDTSSRNDIYKTQMRRRRWIKHKLVTNNATYFL